MHEQGIHELNHVIITDIKRQLTLDSPPEDIIDLAPVRIYSIIFLTIITFIFGIYFIRMISRSWTKESWLRSKARLCYYHSVDMVNLCWDRFYYYSHEFQESLYAIGTGEHRNHHHHHSPLHTHSTHSHGLSSMGGQRRNPATMFHLTNSSDDQEEDYAEEMGGEDGAMYNNHSEHDFPPQYLSVHYKKKVNYLEDDDELSMNHHPPSGRNAMQMTQPTMSHMTVNNLHQHNHYYEKVSAMHSPIGQRVSDRKGSTLELQDEEEDDDEVDSKTGLVEMTSLPKGTRISSGERDKQQSLPTSPSPNKFTDGWF
jgi:hypothetical protein